MSGQKTLLKIFGCNVTPSGKIVVDEALPQFTALINPPGYAHEYQIKYAKNQTLGQAGNESKFHASMPEKLSLKELVLDGTGAIPGTTQTVSEQVDALRNAIYTYVGTKNEAPIVQVVWGSMLFYGRAEGLKIDYTMFRPNGEPLRAKVTLTFVEYKSTEELVKLEQQKITNQTQTLTVKDGDTIENLCDQVYQDDAYYAEVARLNGLTSLRPLKVGSTLIFPPLDETKKVGSANQERTF
ncbi:CIS tube protein [Undibacterium flavidum]|uniref:Peptidoglycan-binding protein n=1 Tax=Undibacterium flavidum TaxID=2762297 RepID=A0ABR6YFF1_9BURK|nr:LysM peptidoglycan-binding domain-containing protein [Undibacterium flavidum]MBC3875296.1 peptidoglycan-binding protein [Undibacterium flavidum]